jgi:hypothetical protein
MADALTLAISSVTAAEGEGSAGGSDITGAPPAVPFTSTS